jgi:hypothetical protein
MALYNAPRDPPLSVISPNDPPLSLSADRPAHGSWIPLIVAAIVAVGLMALIFPRSLAVEGVSPSFTKVQSFAPGPVPVTERRPAPTPI